ncbi:hypothetical protein GCM10011371_24400 [Novosphingobium marinum]|nr:hypothetical protein GCM10011371_24400 [Novosphingobium marinum]
MLTAALGASGAEKIDKLTVLDAHHAFAAWRLPQDSGKAVVEMHRAPSGLSGCWQTRS